MTPSPDATVNPYALRKAREAIERMVRKNEKSNLRPALAQWKAHFAEHDEDPDKTHERWYFMACHKHGEGVAKILMDAGFALRTWRPVDKALERGFDDLAFSMAKTIEVLQSVSGTWRRSERHVLVEAGLRGRVDMLEALFDRREAPEYAQGPDPGAPDLALRANLVLLALARLDGDAAKADLCEVVELLVAKGGSVQYQPPAGFSMVERMPIAWIAAKAGNVAMLKALTANGAHLTGKLPPQGRLPHPIATTMAAALYGINDGYRNNRAMSEHQWQTLEMLADIGVVMDPDDASLKRLGYTVKKEEMQRLLQLKDLAQVNSDRRVLDQATTKASSSKIGRRI